MNFAENLREIAVKTAELAEKDRRLLIEKTAGEYAAGILNYIKEICPSLAQGGKREISGYICKKWLGDRYIRAIADFDDDEIFYKPEAGGAYYTIELFGEDKSYAEIVSLKIAEAIEPLGFVGALIEPRTRKIRKTEKYRRPFSKRPRYRTLEEKEKYVIFLRITW